jgi:hypothetical protein
MRSQMPLNRFLDIRGKVAAECRRFWCLQARTLGQVSFGLHEKGARRGTPSICIEPAINRSVRFELQKRLAVAF